MLTDRALMEGGRRRTGLQALVGIIGLAAIMGVVGFVWLGAPEEPADHPHVVTYYADAYGSDRPTLRVILFSSDCGQIDRLRLQAAAAYASSEEGRRGGAAQLGLMAAASDRMDDLGCPK